MKILYIIASVLFTGLLVISCKSQKPEGQGIAGKITWLEGNQMPLMTEEGEASEKTKSKPIKRTVVVYPMVKFSDLKIVDGLFTEVAVKPITEVESNDDGLYIIPLSPGRYSLFVVEKNGLFANIFDGEGNVQPVTVKDNEWNLLDIVVNYKAVY